MSRLADDDELMEALRDALSQREAVPPHRREAARAAFAWRTVDQDLMTLAVDTAQLAGAGVRSSGGPRVLAFEGHGLTIEIEVDGDRILGQVLSAPTCEVSLESADGGTAATRTDPSGFFSLDAHTGPIRFAVALQGETRRTEWVVL